MVGYGVAKGIVNAESITIRVLKEIAPLILVWKVFFSETGNMVLVGNILGKEPELLFIFPM
jgi:hypothetical protein